MFSFEWPWMALLLILPLLVRYLWPPATPDTTIRLLHPAIERLQRAYRGWTPSHWSSRLYRILLWLAWLGLTLALMRPQWVNQHQDVRSRGYDLMLAVDLSDSMKALDFIIDGERISRLQIIKRVLTEFIERRKGDRIGLILFADTAYTQAPLTTDLDAVRDLLDNALVGMAGKATAIGDAIGLAVKKLRERDEQSRVIILLTDGANTAGRIPPLEAARIAAREGIRVYTIAVGTRGRVPFPVEGRIRWVRMEIDEALLQEIAALTGGTFYRATDSDTLGKIYREIDQLEKTEAETVAYRVANSLHRWPLALTLACLALLAWSRHDGKAV